MPFSTATLISDDTYSATGSCLGSSAGGGATCGAGGINHTPPGLFSETEIFTITYMGSNESFTGNMQLIAAGVPEPASLAILGSALLGFGLIRRRRRTS